MSFLWDYMSNVEVVIETCINRIYEIILDSYDAGFIHKLRPLTYMTLFFAVSLLAENLTPLFSFIYLFLLGEMVKNGKKM